MNSSAKHLGPSEKIIRSNIFGMPAMLLQTRRQSHWIHRNFKKQSLQILESLHYSKLGANIIFGYTGAKNFQSHRY